MQYTTCYLHFYYMYFQQKQGQAQTFIPCGSSFIHSSSKKIPFKAYI